MTGLWCTAKAVPGVRRLVRLAVTGELDLATAGVLRDAVAGVVTRPGLTDLELDLSEVTFCDAAGVTALLWARQEAIERSLGFRVVHAGGAVRRVLAITGVLATLSGRSCGDLSGAGGAERRTSPAWWQ